MVKILIVKMLTAKTFMAKMLIVEIPVIHSLILASEHWGEDVGHFWGAEGKKVSDWVYFLISKLMMDLPNKPNNFC